MLDEIQLRSARPGHNPVLLLPKVILKCPVALAGPDRGDGVEGRVDRYDTNSRNVKLLAFPILMPIPRPLKETLKTYTN